MSSSKNNETATSLLHLCGRKHKAKMGAVLNESVATGPSDFARKQLEKLGWTEGTGLGKNRTGRAEHIRVTKRGDQEALGAKSSAAAAIDPTVTGDQWWKSSVGDTLARLAEAGKKKRKKKSKKDKKDKKSDEPKKRKRTFTDEELFAATGGARFGMRAQTRQAAKWNRAEAGITEGEEAEARKKTEWDGMAAPKILLSSRDHEGQESPETSPREDSDDPDGSPKRKKRKTKTTGVNDERKKGEKPKSKKKSKKSDGDDNDDSSNKSTGIASSKKSKKDKKKKKTKKKSSSE